MRKTTIALTLALGLALTGCSTEDGATDTPAPAVVAGEATSEESATEAPADEATTEDTATTEDAAGTAGPEAAPMSEPVCAEFFQTTPVKLSDRAEADRTMIENGEVTDPVSFGEVNLLSQRIRTVIDSASEEQAALLERINAPFMEASAAVLEDPDASRSDAEITIPEIDVTDSAAAQEEFLASCSG